MDRIVNLFFLLIFIISCENKASTYTDPETGLTTYGKGLSCKRVYLSDGKKSLNRNEFIYGERFYITFEEMEGFTGEETIIYPKMDIIILSQEGDTVIHKDDIYSEISGGVKIDPVVLNANIVTAKPLHSGSSYTAIIDIHDRKGEGTFSATLDFNVVPNDKIKIKSKGLTCDEIYLFSHKKKAALKGDSLYFEEEAYMIFEGLKGLTNEEDQAYIGISILVQDSEGSVVSEDMDLIGDIGIDYSEVSKQIAPSLVFELSALKNPVSCKIELWDKKGKGKIKTTFETTITARPEVK